MADTLAVLLRAVADGSLVVQDGRPVVVQRAIVAEPPRSTVKERRAREKALVALGPKLAQILRDAPEPRRQRKLRNMQPRTIYSMALANTVNKLRALQGLTPSGLSVVRYVSEHPRTTVPEIVIQLDLSKKTVENQLSILKRLDLLETEKVRGHHS